MTPELNVVPLPAPERGNTVENLLGRAADRKLTDALVLGYDADGDFIYLSSAMTRAEALYLVEMARNRIMGVGE
jgi:hypothetical protein